MGRDSTGQIGKYVLLMAVILLLVLIVGYAMKSPAPPVAEPVATDKAAEGEAGKPDKQEKKLKDDAFDVFKPF